MRARSSVMSRIGRTNALMPLHLNTRAVLLAETESPVWEMWCHPLIQRAKHETDGGKIGAEGHFRGLAFRLLKYHSAHLIGAESTGFCYAAPCWLRLARLLLVMPTHPEPSQHGQSLFGVRPKDTHGHSSTGTPQCRHTRKFRSAKSFPGRCQQ